ncbi:MAG TPA: AAA family ATPase [Vicinamibacterales bacterium]|nr:AAA family ATPase [Vicinamibacterales bacterium]
MARLVGMLLSQDDVFHTHVGAMLRGGPVPMTVTAEGPGSRKADLFIIDARQDPSAAIARAESLRASSATSAVFVVAREPNPDLILQSMRAGANEFFTYPPPEDTFYEALRRTAARRNAAGQGHSATTIVFFGAKGGAGTTTMAVNCAVELARLSGQRTIIVDLKPGLGEVGLFLGVRSRYTLVDALDNMHRFDAEFLRELVAKHKSGLEILAGSDNFDRPGSGDGAALEDIVRHLQNEYEYVVVDAGAQINAGVSASLFAADMIGLVANPDVPSIRNAQRLLDRVRQMGASVDRVRLLLNRAAEPFPIPPAQIEAAVGHPIDHMFPSDYKTVSAALNSGVPLALTGSTPLAAQFDSFTRRLLEDEGSSAADATANTGAISLSRLASIW